MIDNNTVLIDPVIDRRDQLPQLINQFTLRDGLEIGVCKGEYSKFLLDNSKLEVLYGVDAWSSDELRTRSALKRCDKVPGKFEKHYEEAKQTLAPYGKRSKLIRMLSEEAVNGFADNSLDFIYVDASHRFSGVALDLILWYPKLRYGGIMAGHDYWLRYRCEVMSAVNGFVVEKEQLLNVTTMERNYPIYPPTWWFIKRSMTKGQYVESLRLHVPRLYAAAYALSQKKVTISLPYEYKTVAASLGQEFRDRLDAELKRMNVTPPKELSL